MTRTIQFDTRKNEVNPLFIKLKDRFTHNDRAVGDLLRQRMTDARSTAREERDTAAEHRVTRANFLPKEHSESSSRSMRSFESTMFVNRQFRTAATLKAPAKKSRFPLRTAVIIGVCFAVLMLLIYSGMQINKLNREINDLKTEVAEKSETSRSLSAAVDRRIDPQAIEKTALTALGMVKSTTVDHVNVDIHDGDSVDLP